jgi:hypothetical protein
MEYILSRMTLFLLSLTFFHFKEVYQILFLGALELSHKPLFDVQLSDGVQGKSE